MRRRFLAKYIAALFIVTVLIAIPHAAHGAATIVILNNDGASTGFNDPTPVTPVGNNTGTTLGQQRLNVFQFAANIWGATLNSSVPITIRASWAPFGCPANGVTLGATSVVSIFRDFPNAPVAGTWYSAALANALSGVDLNPASPEISTQFNVSLGTAGCLNGPLFYLGLDNAHGVDVDLVTVLLHEFTHGFGFATFTNAQSGAQNAGFPTIFDNFLIDDTSAKGWNQMTNAERAASAINNGNLAWNGPFVTGIVPNVLGTPRVRVNSPGAIAGNYQVGTADFGPSLSPSGVTANVAQAFDLADVAGPSTTDGCSALTNAAAVAGRIALVDRGSCNFDIKTKNVQDAGAVGLIVANNVATALINMAGPDAAIVPLITIPSVIISQADGITVKGQLGGGVNATLLVDMSIAQGADAQGRALMFAPTTFSGGSSVSHWDTTEFPNQLMEPGISGDLTHSVAQPLDLTLAQLRDIGWSANPIGDVPFYVRQHYLDFLNRQPDASGLGFWTNDIFNCGIDLSCAEVHRINVSGAFFLSIEFQQTGYLVERIYKTSYADANATSTASGSAQTIKVPIVRFNEFLPDTQTIGQGVQVGIGNWQAQLETNKQNFTAAFVQRSRFTSAYPLTLSPAAFVATLNTNAGSPLSPAELTQLTNEHTTGAKNRAQVLRQIAEHPNLNAAEFNRAFVLMQYFGYLRRNPNDTPDSDYTGYDFWLTKLNQFNGNFQNAEMVKAFINSVEYRQRFGS